MTPYKVIGTYHPTLYKTYSSSLKRKKAAEKIGRYLTDLTALQGYIPHIDPFHGPLELVKAWYSVPLHAEVRTFTSSAMSAEDWHYDGDTTLDADPNCQLILWSSATPTEFMWRNSNDKTIYQSKPFEIVVAKNLDVLHRRPANCPKHRWTFRQRVAV